MSEVSSNIIHCGATRVTWMKVNFADGDVAEISRLRSEVLEYDFSRDELWAEQTLAGLKRLRDSSRGFPKDPHVLLPGFRVLTKSLRVPHVDPAGQRKIIADEAQRNLPYSLDEVYWGWQVLADDGIEMDVQFLAAKRDWLALFCQQLGELGIRPQAVVPESILDWHAWHWMYANAGGAALLINIGARSTNLTFARPEGMALRTINLGGNFLTQSIAEAMGLSFEEADRLKVAFFSDVSAAGVEESKRLLLLSQGEAFLKRLNAELIRSILHFSRQSGAAPDRLLLAGGGAMLDGLAQSLEAKQKLPVAALCKQECTRMATERGDSDWTALCSSLTESLGQAVVLHDGGQGSVDLLPASMRQQWTGRRRKPMLLVAAALVALATWMPMLRLQQTGQQLEAQERSLHQAVAEKETMAYQISATRETIARLDQSRLSLERSLASRGNWIRFFQELQERLIGVGDVWLDELQLSRRTEMIPAPASEPRYDDYGNLVPLPLFERTIYRMNLSGKLLLRQQTEGGERPIVADYDETIITERIRSLIRQFNDIEFVKETGVPTIFWTRLEDGILPFSFNLTVDPERPL